MADIEIKRDDELMVAHIQGTTEEAVEFIDGFFPEVDYMVVDSGRIIIHSDGVAGFTPVAERRGLTVETLP